MMTINQRVNRRQLHNLDNDFEVTKERQERKGKNKKQDYKC